MSNLLKFWRVLNCALFVSSALFLLTIIPNSLFTNAFVLNPVYLPFDAVVGFEPNAYSICTKGTIHQLIETNTVSIYNESEDTVESIVIKEPTMYGFNYNELYIKVIDNNEMAYWLQTKESNSSKKSKHLDDVYYVHVTEEEARHHPSLIWIDLENQWRGWKSVDLLNRFILLPLLWVISFVITIILYRRRKMIESELTLKDDRMEVVVCVYPLICLLLSYVVRWLWQFGLWMYTAM